MKLSVVIPCYNESESLAELTSKIEELITDEIEFILVNNGSTDETLKVIRRLKLHKNIRIINIKNNIGYGNGIVTGLRESKGNIISWTHADLQTSLKDVLKGYNHYKDELNNKTCIVKGERKKRNFFDSFFSFSMAIYCSIVLKKWFYDINAQPKIFHRSFLRKFNNIPLDFSLDLYVLYFFQTTNLSVKSFPVYFNKRKYGNSKGGGTLFGKIKLIKRTLKYIHKLKKTIN